MNEFNVNDNVSFGKIGDRLPKSDGQRDESFASEGEKDEKADDETQSESSHQIHCTEEKLDDVADDSTSASPTSSQRPVTEEEASGSSKVIPMAPQEEMLE